MKRERQEFYHQLKNLDWMFNGIAGESTFLTRQEQDIYFEGVTKLRSLEDKLKKEYDKMIRKENDEQTKKE